MPKRLRTVSTSVGVGGNHPLSGEALELRTTRAISS